ncbi:MAG: FG-GAP-like repeat-containing protein [Pseudomonadota bacterium]
MIRYVLTMLLAAVAAGCGGGGGGGSGSVGTPGSPSTPEIPTPVYSGSQSTAELTKANAADFAFDVFGAYSLAELTDAVWVDVEGATGAISETVAGPDGGTAILSGTLSVGVGTLEIQYNAFQSNGVTFDGRVVQESRRPTAPSAGFIFRQSGPGVVGFDNFRITTPEGTVTLQGSVSISGGNGQSVELNLVVREQGTGESAFYDALSVEYSTIRIIGDNLFGVAYDGRYCDANSGCVDVVSTAPVANPRVLADPGIAVAQGGGFELLGDREVTFAALSSAFVSLGIDLDGDAEPDEFRRLSWLEFSGLEGSATPLIPGPVANAGVLTAGTLGEPLTLDGRFSHDDDGDWLTLEWRLVTKPLESTIEIEPFFAGSRVFTPDVQGEFLFELRASDGQSTTRSTILVGGLSLNPDADPRPGVTRIGALELANPIEVGVPVIVDGRSAAQIVYGGFEPTWFVEGDGNELVTPQVDPFVIEYVTDEVGEKEIRFNGSLTGIGYLSASAQLNIVAGRNVPDLYYSLIGDHEARAFAVADYDGDGNDDVIARQLSSGTNSVVVVLGDGMGGHTLLPPVEGPVDASGMSPNGELATGDLNGDGRLDLALAGRSGVHVFYQQADGVLAPAVEIDYADDSCFSSGSEGDIGIGDVNGDGLDDLVAVVRCRNGLDVRLQQADGTLGDAIDSYPDEFVSEANFLDFNGDGLLDALLGVSGNNQGGVVALGSPDGVFVAGDRISSATQPNIPVVSAGDVNADGVTDLVGSYGSLYEVYLGDGQGGYLAPVAYSIPIGSPIFKIPSQVTVADIDQDGLPDLMFCTASRKNVLFQLPGLSFEPTTIGRCDSFGSGNSEDIVLYDWNGDGVEDLISSGDGLRFGFGTKVDLLNIQFGGLKRYAVPVE